MADASKTDTVETDAPDIYANDVFVDIGPSDISLLFSFTALGRNSRLSKPGVRVILSHDNYMRMVDFLEKRAVLLRRAYMNRTPNLYAGDAEELRKAFDELYPPVDEPVRNETSVEETSVEETSVEEKP